jgi:hypothetical protein
VKQNAILVGAQGMTLLQVQMPMVFPVKKRTLSFDEKDALHVATGGYHYLPYVYRYPPSWKYEGRLVSPYPPLRDHGCDFTFISFELNDPDTDYCLLCFSGV